MSNEKSTPSQVKLGKELKNIRVKKQESVAEVSGAVEIETESLLSIEQGSYLPSEDILLLLISHFNLKKEEAMKLWHLAGYDQPHDEMHEENIAPSLIMLPIDNRVVYTDLVNVTLNNYGVIINFQQAASRKGSSSISVSRVGMSKEHARSLFEVLKQVLDSDEQNIDQSTSVKQKKPGKKQI